MCDALGARIRSCFFKRKVHQRYTERGLPLTNSFRKRNYGGEGGIREQSLFTLSEALVESKRTLNQQLLFRTAPPF